MDRFRKRSWLTELPPARAVGLLVLLGFALFVAYRIFTPPTQTVQVLAAPDGSRSARLQRVYYYADPGFKVAVRKKWLWHTLVYLPSYTNVPTDQLEERIRWSPDSSQLWLEINDQRIWGYDFASQSSFRSP